MSEEKNRKMQMLNKVDNAAIDELQGLIDQNVPPRERAARQYVIDAFRKKMPDLIPFALENKSILKLASYLLNYTIGSPATLFQYTFGVYRFSKWLNKKPDEMVRESILDRANIDLYLEHLENFIGDMRAEKLAPGTINNHVKGVKALYRANNINLVLPHRMSKRVIYNDRAPTPEELAKVLGLGDIREKTIVALLALGGFRVGTLVKLQCHHIRDDLEAGIVPAHIHVEAEITKGKYREYDTFIGSEAVEPLKVYLEARRKGTRYLGPEKIEDNSPLIRDERNRQVRPLLPQAIFRIVHSLYLRAGLIQERTNKGPTGNRYNLRPHSLRKYFRTQLTVLGVQQDYVDYMMGHVTDTYLSLKGQTEHLRTIYARSGLSIRPQTEWSKVDQVKAFMKSLGLKPEQYLVQDTIVKPHRTMLDGYEEETNQLEILGDAIKKALFKELQEKPQKGIISRTER
ncbi:MAG: hypothetical protein QG670_1930 [Thermoproteota archaeon]|nr:hypothetical protein [Thermoproteota archaeon]